MKRFWDKVKITSLYSCWEWQGYVGCYGSFWLGGKPVGAHRVAYELIKGPLTDNCLHHCDNPGCVNPLHLYEGTQKENIEDALRRGRNYNLSKTHCLNGHPFDEMNTYNNPSGSRKCRVCITNYQKGGK